MISPLELVSISDFILSALCLFLAGVLFGNFKTHFGRYGILCYFLLFVGISAFMGGVDHGFFEPIDKRYVPRTLTYLFIALATFSLFRYTILTFTKGKLSSILHIIAYLQLAGFVIASFYIHNFLLVVGNYSPILLFFFIMNLVYIKRSKVEVYFSLFCAIMIIATVVQVLEIELSPMINGDTLFHIIAFIGYLVVFYGIRKVVE